MNFKEQVMMEIACSLSRLSKDPRTKVGAIITRPDFSVVSMGYNGFPPGFPDLEEFWNNRELKHKIVLHAEDNAISYSHGLDLTGCNIFVTHYPCSRCAAKIAKAKISNVYHLNDKIPEHDCDITDRIFNIAKISTYKMEL